MSQPDVSVPGVAVADDDDPREVWRVLRAQTRPVHALLRHVCSYGDPQAELARLLAVLSPSEAESLLPEIRREREWFKAAWERRKEK